MIKEVLSLWFKVRGWKFVDNVPGDLRSFVLLGVPHTSNHDFVPAMAVAHLMRRNAKFVIKSDWLKFPMNLLMVPMGALGVDRKQVKQGHTDAMVQLFKDIPELVLMIAPEGTRGPNARWKTGFYYIAQKAQVPIVLGFVDYEKKESGLGKVIYPSDFEKDMKVIMEFYGDFKGKRPENFLLDSRF